MASQSDVPASTPCLIELPGGVDDEDWRKYRDPGPYGDEIFTIEDLVEKYPTKPWFRMQLAHLLGQRDADARALCHYEKVVPIQNYLHNIGSPRDLVLDAFVEDYRKQFITTTEDIFQESRKQTFYQAWKPTKSFRFPLDLPQFPDGHDTLLQEWNSLKAEGSEYFTGFFQKLSIETNHIESTFLLTTSSTRDLIRRGIDDGTVRFTEGSLLKDPIKIKSIIMDTLSAYDLLQTLADDPDKLTPALICHMHGLLMKSCRILPLQSYVNIGCTRSFSRKTVIIKGSFHTECCPFAEVDNEMEYICRMARQYIRNWRNPFGTSSWLHFVFARCHPFEDGNGRMARLLASIPLIREGYPPICIGLPHRVAYYDSITKAYNGDYVPFIRCIFGGMQDMMTSVRKDMT